MDKQLNDVLQIFHQNDITYWLDSGTLLGLIREGRLLESDRDLDLTVWEEEEEKLKAILPVFRKLGYQIYTATYRGQIFKYNFTPHDVKTQRIVDVNIYRRANTHAWCPMYYFKLSPTTTKSPQQKKSIFSAVRNLLRSVWKELNSRITVNVQIDRLPWAPFLVTATWWIPLKFYEKRIYHQKLQAYIPEKWEGYLTYRYGTWQVPQKDWVFYRDDQGIHPKTPAELVKL